MAEVNGVLTYFVACIITSTGLVERLSDVRNVLDPSPADHGPGVSVGVKVAGNEVTDNAVAGEAVASVFEATGVAVQDGVTVGVRVITCR